MRVWGRTGENDEIGSLVSDDAVEEGSGVEIGASGGLIGEHVKASGRSTVGVVHVRHLKYFELPWSPPLEPEPRRSSSGSSRSISAPSMKNGSRFSSLYGEISGNHYKDREKSGEDESGAEAGASHFARWNARPRLLPYLNRKIF